MNCPNCGAAERLTSGACAYCRSERAPEAREYSANFDGFLSALHWQSAKYSRAYHGISVNDTSLDRFWRKVQAAR